MSFKIKVSDVGQLRIMELATPSSFMPSYEDIMKTTIRNFTGIVQNDWELDRGRKDYRIYENLKGDRLIRVSKEYSFETGTNIINDIVTKIQYYDYNGDIGLEKTVIKPMSPSKLYTINKVIRQNQLDWLFGEGDNLRKEAEFETNPVKKANMIGFADIIDAMYLRYKDDIEEYIVRGTEKLADRVAIEQDEPFKTALDSIDPEVGFPFRQILLFQIS